MVCPACLSYLSNRTAFIFSILEGLFDRCPLGGRGVGDTVGAADVERAFR